MKCDICKKGISETFLKKVVGTHFRDAKGKSRIICSECQKKLKTKEAIAEALSQ